MWVGSNTPWMGEMVIDSHGLSLCLGGDKLVLKMYRIDKLKKTCSGVGEHYKHCIEAEIKMKYSDKYTEHIVGAQ